MTLNYIWRWGSSSVAQGCMKQPFVAIALRSTLFQNSIDLVHFMGQFRPISQLDSVRQWLWRLRFNPRSRHTCDTMGGICFCVWVPVRESLCLFWHETHAKGLRTRSPMRSEGRGKEGPRENRRRWSAEGRAEKTVDRDENRAEKMSALLVALRVFARVHARVRTQDAQKMSQTSPLLHLELTQVHVCSFVLFFHPLGCELRIRKGGVDGVIVIVVGNGHGDTSSNPGRGWSHFT